ncbi:MAG: TRAP transporter small permease subunit [Alphaproteobacteria bacterium]|nr:TRAP transporter small permease subunit [Alphaproteobacteria bacterium]
MFGYIGAWIIAPLVIAMVWEVISRKFFDAPTFWAYEMSYMLMGACFMFGIAYTLQMRRHIRVDFLYDHVSLKKQSLIDLVGFVGLVLPASILLIYGLWDYLLYAYENQEVSGESAWNPVVWPFRTTFVIGIALLILQTVAEIMKCILVLMGEEVARPEQME